MVFSSSGPLRASFLKNIVLSTCSQPPNLSTVFLAINGFFRIRPDSIPNSVLGSRLRSRQMVV
jgi:hypothetical protein